MALASLIRTAAALVALGVAAPVFAPSLLTALVNLPDANGLPDDRQAVPAAPPPVVRPALPDPAPVRSSSSGGARVALRADEGGQFEATAVIDGHSLPVVVDTGASTVAISSDTARALGITPPQSAFRIMVSTANGTLAAAPVTLNEVRVSGIVVRNVQAMVIPGRALSVTLLGMTFLSRLGKFEMSGNQLVLSE